MSLIAKMFLLIAVLMTPVIALFTYSSQQSAEVITRQINIANQNRLGQFLLKVEGMMDQVSNLSNLITKDPDFTEFAQASPSMDRYAYAELMETVERKLGLFSLSVNKMSRINVYFPASQRAVSSDGPLAYDGAALQEAISANWTLRAVADRGVAKRAFVRHFVQPYSRGLDVLQASIVVEVELMEDNLVALLNEFKSAGNNDPFLFGPNRQYVFNGSSDERLSRLIPAATGFTTGMSPIAQRLQLDGKQYLAYYYKSDKLDWTLIDYVPLEDILAPVTRSRQLFYAAVAVLLLFGAVSVVLLYWNVQVPIKQLTAGVLRLAQGNFSERITKKPAREFQLLVLQFNRMAAQIQHLVEKVYAEELRAGEAVMKQLQSQINPHFLHNSLAYIVSMAKMNRTQPVISMAYSLSDYYKYMTRNVTMTTTVREEIAFVSSYVEIMNNQLDKIDFRVELPQDMLELTIPRLLIQPLVENAIGHGLEAKLGGGSLRITGCGDGPWWTITVTDNGVGLSAEACVELNKRLQSSDKEGEQVGLWNVSQRLRIQFGTEAGVIVSPAAGGGLAVELRWSREL
ncbi:sensor histidine kinase [Paenibacillus athensensis]|uniref:HAMP domain-containing protein n=1 Tax=Paenibacillus athensensis TaxID=1967502 RepID=A0A4Y8PR45_9BACL|nr:sensor histidine kinase [Paenibacillus athensensis]MCD1257263.1 sensor histidine kinase [Paenibacillus athensensis]